MTLLHSVSYGLVLSGASYYLLALTDLRLPTKSGDDVSSSLYSYACQEKVGDL